METLAESLYLEPDLEEEETKDRIAYLERILYELRQRFYEIQDPELSDGTIDLYRLQGTHFTITEHNHKIPIGDIEYINIQKAVPGNISYTIFEGYRGHHYALRALRLIGRLLLTSGISQIFITASNDDNYPSIKTIEKFGGERYHQEDYVTGPIPFTCDLKQIYSK